MKRKLHKFSLISLAMLVVVCAAPAVFADWFPGDDYKMHYPQLPDPNGWDVFAGTNPDDGTQKILADDWKCSETGYVSDVHLWGSWKQDIEGQIESLHLSIHDDVPVDPTNLYSHPGNLLWERDFSPTELKIISPYPGTVGIEGWYNPNTNEVIPDDHQLYHQINIENIPDPFVQEVGNIYWLDVTVRTSSSAGTIAEWGWKTSLEHFNDDAVWGDANAVGGVDLWRELRDPVTGVSLDMAFVITGRPIPEPTSMALALIALVGLWSRSRH